MKLRKVVAMLTAVMMLCCIIPFSAAAEGNSATIDFTDIANRVSYSTEKQVWAQNGITVTNDKGASTSNVGDYGGEGYPARFYKNSTLMVEYVGMTKLEFHCNTTAYATALLSAIGADATVSDKVVTVTLNGEGSFSCVLSGGQVRVDSITVYGEGGGETPDVPVDPDPEPDTPEDPPVSDEIETDYPFLFGMTQWNVSEEDVYFLNGEMDGYYMATTTDPDEAIVVYLEAADGGYYFYTYVDDAKTYINMVVSADGKHVNGAYESRPSTVYRYDAYLGTLIADVDGTDYWFGTRNDNTYTTMGPCKVAYEGFYGEFYYFTDDPDYPDTPDDPDDPDYDDLIDTTVPYLLGMVQYNVSEEDVYFLDGGMNGYYMTTTTDENAAILVYLEKVNGGYYLYTYDECDYKLYINMVVSADGKHVNGVYEYTASTVYTYDWDLWTLVAEINGGIYAFGTRNDKQYTTMGPVNVDYDGFHADLYYFEEDSDCYHEYEITEIEPTCGADGEILYECVVCGYAESEVIPATGEHVYDDDYDADCNVCGDLREVPERPVYVGTIAATTGSAAAGDTVDILIQVNDNPGIVSAKVKVHFDTTVLKLVGCAEGEFSAGGYSWGDVDAANEKGYFIVNWCDATHPDSVAQLLATLTFKVQEGAEEGTYAITLEFKCDEDIFNANDDTVWFEAVNGAVVVVNTIPGDANGDGKLNNRDLGLLQRYLNGWTVDMNENAADVNGDGKVNNRDLGTLQKMLNAQ